MVSGKLYQSGIREDTKPINPNPLMGQKIPKISFPKKFDFTDSFIKLFGFFKSGAPSQLVGNSGKMSGRPMKFPYTFSAKIAQFPYKFYFNNTFLVKYYLLAVIVSFPVFYKLQKLSYSPNNVRVWEEKRKALFTPHVGHH